MHLYTQRLESRLDSVHRSVKNFLDTSPRGGVSNFAYTSRGGVIKKKTSLPSGTLHFLESRLDSVHRGVKNFLDTSHGGVKNFLYTWWRGVKNFLYTWWRSLKVETFPPLPYRGHIPPPPPRSNPPRSARKRLKTSIQASGSAFSCSSACRGREKALPGAPFDVFNGFSCCLACFSAFGMDPRCREAEFS